MKTSNIYYIIINDNIGLQNLYRKCHLFGQNRFPLNFGRWIRIRSPFSAIRSEFSAVASFAFFRVKIYIFERFSKFIIFKNLFFFYINRESNLQEFAKWIIKIDQRLQSGKMVKILWYFQCKTQNAKQKFDFPEKQGKHPLWYIKLFVSYHITKVTNKNKIWGLFSSPGLKKLSWPTSRKI